MANELILGDNLEILKGLSDNSVDLCYIDPPFFSNRNYEVIWGDTGEIASFKDRWAGGIEHYINWLYERVVEIYRVLKNTGSFYLHCDWHADAYIKTKILDRIFGMENFRNHIVWCYKTRPQSKKYFGRKHDSIFFYTKTDKYSFNWEAVVRKLSEATVKKYRLSDEKGRLYRLEGRGIKGSPIKSAKDVDTKWELTNPELVVRDYLDEKIGVALEDWWEIDTINQSSNELIGYPTQKPEALLERIIKASSNESDLVLDCFCGGGTTISVARKLNRRFIGIDQSVQAIKVTQGRLERDGDLFSAPFAVKVHKYDFDTIRNSEAFEFEKFIIEKFGGEPHSKENQRGDFGIDGIKRENKISKPIQVKRSDSIGRNVIDNFVSATRRYYTSVNKSIEKGNIAGYIIAFSFSKGAVEEIARLKREDNIEIKLIEVADIIPLAHKPKIEVSYSWKEVESKKKRTDKEISFEVKTISGNKIELYQWDFDYDEKQFNPDIFFDKTGKQTKTFESGTYNIAVKAIDTDGIEAIETITLIINGGVKIK